MTVHMAINGLRLFTFLGKLSSNISLKLTHTEFTKGRISLSKVAYRREMEPNENKILFLYQANGHTILVPDGIMQT